MTDNAWTISDYHRLSRPVGDMSLTMCGDGVWRRLTRPDVRPEMQRRFARKFPTSLTRDQLNEMRVKYGQPAR